MRQIRGEMDISPARRLPLLLQHASAQDAAVAAAPSRLLERLAGLAELERWLPGEPAPPSAARWWARSRCSCRWPGSSTPAKRAAASGQASAEARARAESVRAPSSRNEQFVDATHPPRSWRTSARALAELEHARDRAARAARAGARAAARRERRQRADDAASRSTGARRCSRRVILGKRQQVRLCLACLLARGHLLIEDVPGVGKTTLAHALARVLGLEWTRRAVHQRHAAGRHHRRLDLRPRHAAASSSAAARCSRSCCWPMRSTAPAPRRRARCSRPWRSGRSASTASPIALPEPFFVVATQNPHEQLGTYRPARVAARPLPDARHPRLPGCAPRSGACCCRASGASCCTTLAPC